jgi:hypothetical protein
VTVNSRVMLGPRPTPGAAPGAAPAGEGGGVVGDWGAGTASAIGSKIMQQFRQRAGGVPEAVVSLTRL